MVMLSVIIPVFNADASLSRCIESLLLQTEKSCEFIFINDGATDKSQSIIEGFQKSDGRIQLINQQNQGVSVARNNGLQLAKGKYIGFVDADDTVAPDMFTTLIELAERNDAAIVISRYIIHQKGQKRLSTSNFPENQVLNGNYIHDEIIPYFIQDESLNNIWNKIYTRDLIQNNGITFPAGVAIGEDGLFNMQAFHRAEKVYFTDFAGYNYIVTEGSAMRDFTKKNYFDTILQEYKYDYSNYENASLSQENISVLKAEKLLKKSISLIHEYTDPANKIRFTAAYKSISTILNNAVFKRIIKENVITSKKGNYEQFILWSARNKWIYLLFIATAYSRFRNK